MEYIVGSLVMLIALYGIWYLITRILVSLFAFVIWNDDGKALPLLFLLWFIMLCPILGEGLALALAALVWYDSIK